MSNPEPGLSTELRLSPDSASIVLLIGSILDTYYKACFLRILITGSSSSSDPSCSFENVAMISSSLIRSRILKSPFLRRS